MSMDVVLTKEFAKRAEKLDWAVKERLGKLIKRLQEYPEAGKPLQYDFAGKRSARLPPFRIIYCLENDKIIFLTLEHRSRAYD